MVRHEEGRRTEGKKKRMKLNTEHISILPLRVNVGHSDTEARIPQGTSTPRNGNDLDITYLQDETNEAISTKQMGGGGKRMRKQTGGGGGPVRVLVTGPS